MLSAKKLPVLLLDLDETLADSTVFDHIYRNYCSGDSEYRHGFRRGFKQEFEDDVEKLLNDILIDNEQFHFAKSVKKHISRGGKVALVTFNTCLEYANFVLAVMGLSEDEINRVVIRFRENIEDVPEDKNEYIDDVLSEWGIDPNGESSRRILVDDNEDNCTAARENGTEALQVDFVEKRHIDDLMISLGLETVDVDSIVLPSPRERFELALKMFGPEEQVDNTLRLKLYQMPQDLATIFGSPESVELNSNNKRPLFVESQTTLSHQSALYCSEALDDFDLEFSSSDVVAAAKRARTTLNSKTKEQASIQV